MNLDKRDGFTLIELMLAMTFLSFLLIAIATTVIDISQIYNKGLTLKSINQIGRTITDDVRSTMAFSDPFPISGNGSRYVVQSWGGRLCVGSYSYIWNTGNALFVNDPTRLNLYSAPNSATRIRFVKVFDPGGSYCDDPTKSVVYSGAIELISGGQHNLAMQSFSITSYSTATDAKTNQALYNISVIMSTNNQDALKNTSGFIECKAPNEANSDPDYCAVGYFNFTALAGSSI